MAEYLGTVKMGGFYKRSRFLKKNKILKRPKRNEGTSQSPDLAYCVADIPKMSGGMDDYIIGDTPKEEENQLIWHKIRDKDKILFICDRNILVFVSRNDLNEQGYILGKKIKIDNKEYLCRVLTGAGKLEKDEDGKITHKDNEWDRFICRKECIGGLPEPDFIDLSEGTGKKGSINLDNIPSFPKFVRQTTLIEDKKGANNSFWNWAGCHSWCQERHESSGSPCAYRGNTSGGCLLFANPDTKNEFLGFRPVLEINCTDNI